MSGVSRRPARGLWPRERLARGASASASADVPRGRGAQRAEGRRCARRLFTFGGVAPVAHTTPPVPPVLPVLPVLPIDRELLRFNEVWAAAGQPNGVFRLSPGESGQRLLSLWRGDSAHRDGFGNIAHAPTSFVLDRQHGVVREIAGRIPAGLWDDIVDLVLA